MIPATRSRVRLNFLRFSSGISIEISYGREAAMSDVTDHLVAEMGYHCALTLEQNIVRCATVDVLRLPRLIVSAQVGRVLFTLWQRFVG